MRLRISTIKNTLQYHLYFYMFQKEPIKGLNLGSGGAALPGFLNMDANPFCHCDIAAKVNRRLKFRKSSVERIYASHIFEHIPRQRAAKVLKHWYRLLKPGGKLYVCVPDFEVLARIYLDNLDNCDTDSGRCQVDLACEVIFGGQYNRYDFHYFGYSLKTLKPLLESAGFKNVRRFDREKMDWKKDASCARINGIQVSLNIEADK